MNRGIEDGVLTYHTINILSKRRNHLRWRSKRVVVKSIVRREKRMGKGTVKTPQVKYRGINNIT